MYGVADLLLKAMFNSFTSTLHLLSNVLLADKFSHSLYGGIKIDSEVFFPGHINRNENLVFSFF